MFFLNLQKFYSFTTQVKSDCVLIKDSKFSLRLKVEIWKEFGSKVPLWNKEKTWVENKTVLYFAYKYPEIVHFNTYISYDLLTLIGEVGGLLGLTLGASGLSIIMSLLEKCLSRISKKKIENEEPQMECNRKSVLSVSSRFSAGKIHSARNVRPRQSWTQLQKIKGSKNRDM